MILMLAAAIALEEPAFDKSDAELLAKYERTGERSNCLPGGGQTDFTAIGESLLLVRSNGRYYLTETRGSCSRVDNPFYHMELTIRGGQICENQIVKIVDSSGFFAGSCSLGDFELLTKKPKEAAAE
jgi:hypothetical protein